MKIISGFSRDDSLDTYWRKRLEGHTSDRYRGYGLVKFPEDLRTYQHVIEETTPEVIVELGTASGGSAIWFADQLQVLCGWGSVITVDLNVAEAKDPRISFVVGDLRTVFGDVQRLVAGRRTMVVDDSAHTFEVTLAALRTYAPLVTKGCYFVVEDTIVDTDLSIWVTSGAGKAVDAFLAEEPRFERRDRDTYGITMHMGGWLEAVT